MEELVRSGNTPQKMIFRIGIILGAADGLSNAQPLYNLGTSRSSVLKWPARYRESGLHDLLDDAPRSGRKKTTSADKEAAVQATCGPNKATHWSTRSMGLAFDKLEIFHQFTEHQTVMIRNPAAQRQSQFRAFAAQCAFGFIGQPVGMLLAFDDCLNHRLRGWKK